MHSYSWWFFPHPFAKICVPSKWVNIFPNFRGENKKSLKPPTCSFNDETFQKILFKTFIHKFIERFFSEPTKTSMHPFYQKSIPPTSPPPQRKIVTQQIVTLSTPWYHQQQTPLATCIILQDHNV